MTSGVEGCRPTVLKPTARPRVPLEKSIAPSAGQAYQRSYNIPDVAEYPVRKPTDHLEDARRAMHGSDLVDEYHALDVETLWDDDVEWPRARLRSDRADYRPSGDLVVRAGRENQRRAATRLLRAQHRIEFNPGNITRVEHHGAGEHRRA